MEREPQHGVWSTSPERYFDNPAPVIRFASSRFVLTGVFAYGKREDIESQIKALGGSVARAPAKSGCYVIVGTLPSKDWLTTNAGRKLQDALRLRDDEDCFVRIVGEDAFVAALIKAQQEGEPFEGELPLPPVPWSEILESWFSPMRDADPDFVYEYYSTKSYMVVHSPGKKSNWICRIRYDRTGVPFAMQVAGMKGFQDIFFRRSLPEFLVEKLAVGS
ncbi:hypothetical protein LJC15_00095 [Desulfovibrio sp. OttesenSCG-928-G11]|nr:hypothetical protein [Desulfovibrio sp. OttesenSCG-928-G11]